MQNQVIPFQFHNHTVRAFPHENGISFWMVGKDVATALGYNRTRDALKYVPANHKGAIKCRTLGGDQEMLCIDEAGLYRLVLRSNKPEAEPFMEWVTAEVLPSIRRTGGYTAPQAPQSVPQATVCQTPAQYMADRARIEAELEKLMRTPILLTPEEFEEANAQRLRVGRKIYLVAELVRVLDDLGVERKVAEELTGLNNNTIRQHALIGRRRKGGAA